MESLNFELERGSMCHVVHGENCEYIVSENKDVWMQITVNGNNVSIQVFPRNIEESYIGKECKENEELRYILSCRNEEEAVKCCEFFADFINAGYGDFTKHGKAWVVALDLKDINEILASGDLCYRSFSLDANENNERISEFCEMCNIQSVQTVFVCIYGPTEATLNTYDSIVREIEAKITDDCNLWNQFIPDNRIKDGNCIIHLIYS